MTSIGQFTYIKPPSHNHPREDILLNVIGEPKSYFTVKKQGGKYTVYPTWREFQASLQKLPMQERQYHEICFDGKQKLRFDIDMTGEQLIEFIRTDAMNEMDFADRNVDTVNADTGDMDRDTGDASDVNTGTDTASDVNNVNMNTAFSHILDVIQATIETAFFVAWGEFPEFCRCVSKDPTGKKFSAHLIITGYHVSSSQQGAEFTKRVNSDLPPGYKFLDLGVNKRLQSFRIANCHKGDMRIKQIISGETLEESLISVTTGCKELPDLVQTYTPKFNTVLQTTIIDSVLDICRTAGLLRDHKFHAVRGTIFVFNRLRPSFCNICKRNHDSDNSLFVTVAILDGVCRVYQNCRRYVPDENEVLNTHAQGEHSTGGVEIGEFHCDQEDTIAISESFTRESYIKSQFQQGFKNTTDRTLYDDLDVTLRHVYSEPTMRDFEKCKTLAVHARMKMGKTRALHHYLRHFTAEDVIRYISFRQTFSGNIKEKFPDFHLYSESQGVLNQKRVICQVESLHRLYIDSDPPDLLILDECESIFEQFDSGLLRNFNDCFAKFQYLLRYSKHLVLMDAYLSDRTYRIIQRIRGNEGLIYHHNTFQNGREDTYNITGDRGEWLTQFHKHIAEGKRIAVQMSSLGEARAIERNLRRKYPTKCIKLYSSETSMTEKKLHFSDVNLYWGEIDILIYTPTVSAGVSFEKKHFDLCYCYFSDKSCGVETCLQMMGRIRDVADRSYYICFSASGARLPVDIDEIRSEVYSQRQGLYATHDNTGLLMEYDAQGEIRYHTTPYFDIWLENTRMRNLSRNGFIRRMISHLKSNGSKIQLDWFEGPIDDDLLKEHQEVTGEIKLERDNEVATAVELTQEEYDSLREKMTKQLDLTRLELAAMEKYRMRQEYSFAGEMTAEWVMKYRRVRQQYRNINRLLSAGSDLGKSQSGEIDPAVEQIKNEERALYDHSMHGEELDQISDLQRRYTGDKHRIALSLLLALGWAGIEDRRCYHEVGLAERIRSGLGFLMNMQKGVRIWNIDPISQVSIRVNLKNDMMLIKTVLATVNKVLNQMYGVAIHTEKKTGIYSIRRNDCFTMNPKVNKPLLRAEAWEDEL